MSLNEITLDEASRRTGRSKESIRRQIGHGIQGRKVPSRHGRFQWMVDADTLPPADPHTIEAQEPQEPHEGQQGANVPEIPAERLLGLLEAIATKSDVENIIQSVDNLAQTLGSYRARIEELERELAEAKRPWWRKR